MHKKSVSFWSATVQYYFGASFEYLSQLVDKSNTVILTDENVFAAHGKKLKEWNTIVLPAGENTKTQSTVDQIINQLIEKNIDRSGKLIGFGGGVITDLAGYVAGIYLRGISCGFVPTSLLGMIDASIGGKCGINVGVYKNMVGLVRHPDFILYDYSLLKTLPKEEWSNGFAEIIKHACIKDAGMFELLETHKLSSFQKDANLLADLIEQNVLLKTKIVVKDELEKDGRRQLNFGHTFGHSIENLYHLPHGQAVSIGMVVASRFSEKIAGFESAARVEALLKQYGLPGTYDFEKDKVIDIIQKDKKKEENVIHYVLLPKVGKAMVTPLTLEQIGQQLDEI